MASQLNKLCKSLEDYYGATIELSIEDKFGVTFNEAGATESASNVIRECFGEEALQAHYQPSMGGEDFSYMLAACPGAYIHIGSGDAEHPHGLHNPEYDFNDRIIPMGVELLARLALESLEKQHRMA